MFKSVLLWPLEFVFRTPYKLMAAVERNAYNAVDKTNTMSALHSPFTKAILTLLNSACQRFASLFPPSIISGQVLIQAKNLIYEFKRNHRIW